MILPTWVTAGEAVAKSINATSELVDETSSILALVPDIPIYAPGVVFVSASAPKAVTNDVDVRDVHDATPKLGVTSVGEVASTIAPVPVGATVVVIAKVPEDVIDAGVTDRIDGTVIPTEVTVPVVGVVQVIAVAPP